MKNVFTAVTTSILLASTMTLGTTVSADEHETVESLKGELATLNNELADSQSKQAQLLAGFESANETRDSLSKELGALHSQHQQDLAASQSRQTQLLADVESANQTRDSLAKQLAEMQNQHSEQAAAQAVAAAKIQQDSDAIAETAFVQIKSALAQRDAAKAEVIAEQNKNNFAEIMLKKVQNDAARQTAAAAALAEELAAANAANEILAMNMESVINDRDNIATQAATANNQAAADMAAASDKIATLETQLESAVVGRAHIMGRWESLYEELKGIKNEAMKAQEAANWGKNVSESLASQLSQLPNVEVTTADNKVNLRVKGEGMFKTGGTTLSEQGKYVLQEVGQALQNQTNSTILVTGHTDNIPTGKGSRYKDNVELSTVRAEVAMNHLGGATDIDVERMSFSGMGDTQPIASNSTSNGRSMNRRVEIILSAQ